MVLARHPKTGWSKKSFKKWHVFLRGKRGVKAPRLPRNSPQLHHKNTTICTPFFSKTPAKTPLHQHSKKIPLAKIAMFIGGSFSFGTDYPLM
jgi:hypothetical protein